MNFNEDKELLKDYFKDISKYPVLSSEEQIELARKVKNGDNKAKDKLITSNLRFVITCARQYSGQGVPLIDLINAGNYGLLLSCANFDPERGYKFLSFAVWYIRREIIKEIYNNGRTIRYPITYISKITKVKKAYDEYVLKYQKEPSDEELIKLTNLTEKQYNSVITNKSYCQSIDTPISKNEKTTIEDILEDNSNSSIDSFGVEAIENSLKILNPKEYLVITKYYGLCGNQESAIKDIAKELGLGDERIRQIRKSAIKKLKSRCGKTLKTLL